MRQAGVLPAAASAWWKGGMRQLNDGACAAGACGGAGLVAGCSSVSDIFWSKKVDYKSPARCRRSRFRRISRSSPVTTATRFRTRIRAAAQPSRVHRGSPAAQAKKSVVLPTARRFASRARQPALAGRDRAAGQIVVRSREFWQENGFIVVIERPDAGVMETDWAENRAKIGGRHPQHARQVARPGVLDRRARQVPHAARAQARTGKDRYLHQPPRHGRGLPTSSARTTADVAAASADPELEAEMLRRLMVRLGAEISAPRPVLRRQQQGRGARQACRQQRRHAGAGSERAVRSRLAPRRPRARPRRLHGRGPRPLRRACTSCATSIRRSTAAQRNRSSTR